jgi:hypothetical protein
MDGMQPITTEIFLISQAGEVSCFFCKHFNGISCMQVIFYCYSIPGNGTFKFGFLLPEAIFYAFNNPGISKRLIFL